MNGISFLIGRGCMRLSIVLALSLAGCSNFIHVKDDFSSPTGVQVLAIDAKQRVVIFSKVRRENTTGAKDAQTLVFDLVTCAEPSPDALSALSSSIGASAQNATAIANLALAQTESAASIGLRTQSIQLLRDGMYRLCEAYAANAITKDEMYRQQRRYQNLMLSLLAIEQLTGAVVSKEVGIGEGASAASVADGAHEAAANKAVADKAVEVAQKEQKSAEETLAKDKKLCADDPKTNSQNCTDQPKDQATFDEKDKALKEAQIQQNIANQGLKAAKSAVRTSAAGGKVAFDPDPGRKSTISDNTARYIAEATRSIVSTTLLAGFAQEECSRIWDLLGAPTPAELLARKEEVDKKVDEKSTALNKETDLKKKSVIAAELQAAQQAKIIVEDQLSKSMSPIVLALNAIPENTRADFINKLFSRCERLEAAVTNVAALYKPDYGDSALPFAVLGASGGVKLAPDTQSQRLKIIGGRPPYVVIVYSSAITDVTKTDLRAQIDPNNASVLLIERPKGASLAGNATIVVLDGTNAHIDIAVTLTLLSQKIDFQSIQSLTVGGTATLTATSTSSVPVTFTATPSNICEMASANAVKGKAEGVCKITAEQPGDARYEAAKAEQSIMVAKNSQTVTIKSPSNNFKVGETIFVSTTADSSLVSTLTVEPAAICEIDPAGTLKAKAVGNCLITATQKGDSKFDKAIATQSISVTAK